MSDSTEKGLWIITESTSDDGEVDGARGGYDTGASYGEPEPPPVTRRRTLIRAEDLKHQMSAFLEVVEEVFDQTQARTQAQASAQGTKSPMRLDEIELSVEINGEGQISLLGTGGKAGGKGAINLKFKRQE